MPSFYRKKNQETGRDDLFESGTNRHIGPNEFSQGGFTEDKPVVSEPTRRTTENASQAYADSPLKDFKSRKKVLDLLKEAVRRKQNYNKDISSGRQYWRTVQADQQSFVDPRIQLLSPAEQRNLRNYTQATASARLRGLSDEEKYRGDRMEDILGGVRDIQKGKLDQAKEDRYTRNDAFDNLGKYDDLGLDPTDKMYREAGIDVTNGRTGGSISWRNNNPGNLKYSDWQKEYGAIKDGNSAFAVFKTTKDAEDAYKALLTSKRPGAVYAGLTPNEAMWKWSGGGKDSSPSYTYDDLVKLGAPAVSKPFSKFTEPEWRKFFDAQKQREGWDDSGHEVRGAKKDEDATVMNATELKSLINATGIPGSELKSLYPTYQQQKDAFEMAKTMTGEDISEELNLGVLKSKKEAGQSYDSDLNKEIKKIFKEYGSRFSDTVLKKIISDLGIEYNKDYGYSF